MSETGGTGSAGLNQPGSQSASRAVEQAADQAREAGQQVLQAGTQALGQAKDVAQDAVARGSSLAGEVRDRVAAGVQQGKDDLAGRLEDVARAVHRSGEQLEGHQDWLASLVERGAAELRVLAGTVRTNDLGGLMGGLQDLARRQPALFAGAAMAAGFALVRLGRVAAAGASREDLPHLPPSVAPEASRERS